MFPHRARLINFLPAQCFLLTQYQIYFEPKRIDTFFVRVLLDFSCDSMPFNSCSALHGVSTTEKEQNCKKLLHTNSYTTLRNWGLFLTIEVGE